MSNPDRLPDLHGELRRLGYLEARVDRFLDDARSPFACGARAGVILGPPVAIAIALHHLSADPTLLAAGANLALESLILLLGAVLALGGVSALTVALARPNASTNPGVRLAILALPTLLVTLHLVWTLLHLGATFPSGAAGVARSFGFGAITLASAVFVWRTMSALVGAADSAGPRAFRGPAPSSRETSSRDPSSRDPRRPGHHRAWTIARGSAVAGLLALSIGLVLPDRPPRAASPFEPLPTGERLVWVHVEGLAGRVLEEVRQRNSMPSLLRRLETSAIYALDVNTAEPPSTLWTTLATGTLADRHGIHRFARVGVDGGRTGERSFGDVLRRTRELCLPFTLPLREAPVSAFERRVPTFGEIVADRGHRTIGLNGWCTGPVGETRELIVSDRAFRQAILPNRADAARADFSRVVESEVSPAEIRRAIAERLARLSQRPDPIDEFDATVLALAGDLVRDYADPHVVCATLSGLDLALRSSEDPNARHARLARLDLALDAFLAALPTSTNVVLTATSPSEPRSDSTSSAFVSLHGPAFAPEVTGLILDPVQLAPTLLAVLGFPSADDRGSPALALLVPRLQPRPDFRVATYGERSVDRPRDYSEEHRHLRALETLGYIRSNREPPAPREPTAPRPESEEKPK